ncbi:SpoIIIAC/SpoIIIAD family protein, partial [Thermovenabulum sp.]
TLAGVILVLLMIIPLLTRLFSNIRTMFQIYY